MIRGSIARVSLAEAESNRDKLTQAVVRSNQMEGRTGEISFQGGGNPIHHVIYIIKENRTYDQLFGDIREANGDPSLVMYGEDITPNQHKLARQFGILDNFYDSGEVSGNGHVWSTAAITSDYTEKTWEITYRGKERHYDYEGYVGDSNPMTIGIPDVNEPGTGYLWGNLARHNLTYRNYGEYVNTWWCEDIAQNSPAATGAASDHKPDCARKAVEPGEDLPDNLGGGKSPYQYKIPLIAYDAANKPELRGHFDPNFADFNLSYPDQFRADEFLREFGAFVRARESGSGRTVAKLRAPALAGRSHRRYPSGIAHAERLCRRQRSGGGTRGGSCLEQPLLGRHGDLHPGGRRTRRRRSRGCASQYCAGDQQVFAGYAAATLRGPSLLHHGQHDPYDGSSAGASAHEQQRRICRSHGASCSPERATSRRSKPTIATVTTG